MADVFVSYSRKDGEFVHELYDVLAAAGRDVWVDWEDIPPASEWEQAIYDSIDAAESVVFVVSPNSLSSNYCGAELRRAGDGGKRVVPIAIDGADPAAAPPAIRQLNWIWARATDDRAAAFAALERALDTDLAWSRAHTRLLVRAVEWDERMDGSLLLRGRDLEEAERVLAANAGSDPRPTELQQRYLHASRRAASHRQRLLLGGVIAALAVSIGFGVVALLQRNTANERARVAESQTLALRSADALETSPRVALGHAVEAYETSPTPDARLALRRALVANPVVWTAPGSPAVPRNLVRQSLAFSPDGSLLLGVTPGGKLSLWDAPDGNARATPTSADRGALGPGGRVLRARGQVLSLSGGGRPGVRRVSGRVVALGFAGDTPLALLSAHGRATVLNVATGARVPLRTDRVPNGDAFFSGDGKRIVVMGTHRSGAWDTRTGALLTALPAGFDAAVSPDGTYVVTTDDSRSQLWSIDKRFRIDMLGPSSVDVAFSPDSSLVLGVGNAGDGRVWRTRNGEPVRPLPGFGGAPGGTTTLEFANSGAFSPDGTLVALAGSDGIVRVWEIASGKQVGSLDAGWASSLAFAPRGGLLAAMTWDGYVAVARVPGSTPLRTGWQPIRGCAGLDPVASPDGRWIATAARGGAAIWRPDGSLVQVLRPPARSRTGIDAGELAFGAGGDDVAVSAVTVTCGLLSQSDRFGAAVWRIGRPAASTPAWPAGDSTGALQLGPDGSLVAFGRGAWRSASGQSVPALDGILALSGDGRTALVARNRSVEVVEAPSGQAVAHLDGPVANPAELIAVLDADGRRALTDDLGRLRLWDAETGELVARIDRKGQGVNRFRFSRDGRRVLVVFNEHVAAFDAGTGKRLARVPAELGALSDDAAFAAEARRDGTVDVIDVDTGVRVNLPTDTTTPIETVAFGATSDVLLLGDANGDAHVLRCAICASDEELLARAKASLELQSDLRTKRPPQVAQVA